jgi:OOP family OmpA-OmpF porin
MRNNFGRVLCVAITAGLMTSGCILRVKKGNPKTPPKQEVKAKAKPKAKAKAKPKRRALPVVRNKLTLPAPIVFQTGSGTILDESFAVLEDVKAYLDDTPNVTKLRIEGHTSTTGDDGKNQDLSELRSMAVAAWLVANGVDCERLVPAGFGETRLIDKPEETDEHRANNRRVDFVNAAINGKAILGFPLDGGGTLSGDPCAAE